MELRKTVGEIEQMPYAEFRMWLHLLHKWRQDPKKRQASRPESPEEILKKFQLWAINCGQ